MKPLKFIHITKCAGTSIEDIGKKMIYVGVGIIKNITGGMNHL